MTAYGDPPRPPRLARRLLEHVVPPASQEFLLGDLDEEFIHHVVPTRGARAGRRWYWWQALRASVALGLRRRPHAAGGRTMFTPWSDLRHAVRVLVKAPAFTLIAVATLALGIGANTAIFTWLKAFALDPLPGVTHAGRLVVLTGQNRDGTGCCGGTSYPNYLDYRDRTHTLDGLLGWEMASINLTVDGRPQRLDATIVTGNYFDVLGVKPALGRTFVPADYRTPGTHPVAVISYGLWQRVFGGDPGIVNRQVTINGHPFTVIGVAPNGFTGAVIGVAFDLFVPVTMQAEVAPGPDLLHARGVSWLDLVGRLAPGVTVAQARAEMNAISAGIAHDYPGTYDNRTLGVYEPTDAPLGLASAAFPVVVILMIIVGLVLAIASANVANLLLARARGRRREMAIRQAMGATRLRLVAQLLVESALLSAVAALIGLVIAVWISRAIGSIPLPFSGQVAFNTRIDPLVLAFTAAIALGASLAFGLVPAFQTSRVDLVPALKADRNGPPHGRGWLRGVLVGGQVALSVVVLICASLFLRSLWNARTVDPGFDTRSALLASIDLFPSGYTEATGDQAYRQLLERIGAIPGVEGVTLARRPPLTARGPRGAGIDQVEGYQPGPDERLGTLYDTVGPAYFRTMGIPLLRGRDFTDRDDASTRDVVVVNATMARTFWPDQNPLGRHIRIGDRSLEVIGVARDVKYRSLSEPPRLYMYLPVFQHYEPDETLVVRTAGAPTALVGPLRQAVHAVDPALPLFRVVTMAQHLQAALTTRRIAAAGAAAFGLLALLLAMVGLYGVVACSVSQRTHEIGLRMALGARPADVVRMVVVRAMRPAVAGAIVGLVAAFGASRFVRAMLYGVAPTDPVTFAGVTVVLLVVALAAAWLPARRAMKVDPVDALRYE